MRARVPYDALNWLLKRLEEQQVTQQGLMDQSQQTAAQVAQDFSQTPPQQEEMGQGISQTQPPIMPS